jgi:hypothetical protein
MFPETFVEKWLERLTKRGETVLDLFCGRGTTPFQSILMDRVAVACDVNDVAYCVTKAKTNAPTASAVRAQLTRLEQEFDPVRVRSEREAMPEFFRYAYHPWTLGQILHLRQRLRWRQSRVDCMIAAMTLGILHGESAKSCAYLSAQMPRTISTKPAYSVRFWKTRRLDPPARDAFAAIRRQIDFRYESTVPDRTAAVFHGDMRELPHRLGKLTGRIQHVVTSPPYLDVTNFEEDQWLRLWFLGGPPHPTRGRVSRDDRHSGPAEYWRFIGDMWRSLSVLLAPKANVVLRVGATAMSPDNILSALLGCSVLARRKVELVECEVSRIHGRQTDSFRPGSRGCLVELDCFLRMS